MRSALLRSRFTRTSFSLALCGLFGAPAFAADLELSLQIPQLDTAEVHRPYVAVWLERQDHSVPATLALWYQQKRAPPSAVAGPQPEGGTKYLPDLRQWWRRAGRDMKLPVDGVSGATRNAGEHHLSFREGEMPLNKLPPGEYRLMVESAREDGGRELLNIPFQWPVAAAQEIKAQGKSELGALTLALKP